MRTLATALVIGLNLFSTSARAAGELIVMSPALADGATLPSKYAGQGGPRKCGGDNVSLPLRWSNPPNGTRSFAIVIIDLDGYGEPNGQGFIHWIAYGIPRSTTSLAEGEGNRPSSKFLTGKNTLGLTTYAGPCPRVGKEGPHQYAISVQALSIEPQALQAGLTISELSDVIRRSELDSAHMTVYYPREGGTPKK